MKKGLKKLLLVLGLIVSGLVILFFSVRAIGVCINRSVPDNGYNETAYVEVNGTKEWISIYSQDKSNPVLLILHGGPGSCQSAFAYEYQKEWGKKYTVVTWDQRGCGLSRNENLKSKEITMDLMLSDTLGIINYVQNYLGVEKITILGYSWGTMLGAKLAFEYPQYVDAFIAAGQLVDTHDNEVAFKKIAEEWAKNDSEGLEMVQRLTPDDLDAEHYSLKTKIMARYGYSTGSNGYGFSYYTALYFNPYYSIVDFYYDVTDDHSLYLPFINSDEFNTFSIDDQIEYQVPYFFICGDKDYQTNYEMARSYYEMIKAPQKEYFLIKDCTHGLMTEKTDAFTEILMQIADRAAMKVAAD